MQADLSIRARYIFRSAVWKVYNGAWVVDGSTEPHLCSRSAVSRLAPWSTQEHGKERKQHKQKIIEGEWSVKETAPSPNEGKAKTSEWQRKKNESARQRQAAKRVRVCVCVREMRESNHTKTEAMKNEN